MVNILGTTASFKFYITTKGYANVAAIMAMPKHAENETSVETVYFGCPHRNAWP